MLVCRSQFYAFVLLFVCLVTNIVFFAEVRKPFFGDDDPMAPVQLAFSDLDIPAKIAEFYPKTQSKGDEWDEAMIDETQDAVPPTPPVEKEPAPRRQAPPAEPSQMVPSWTAPSRTAPSRMKSPQAEPVVSDPIVDPIVDPFTPFSQPPIVTPGKAFEEPKPAVSVVAPDIAVQDFVVQDVVVQKREKPTMQTVAVTPFPAPIAAVVQPVVAEQFKPIIDEQKPVSQKSVSQKSTTPVPVTPFKPSSVPVWDTTDSILARPIRYD